MRIGRLIGRLRQGKPRFLIVIAVTWLMLYALHKTGSYLSSTRRAQPAKHAVSPPSVMDGCVNLIRSQTKHYDQTARCLRRTEIGAHFINSSHLQNKLVNCRRPAVAWDAPLAGGLTYGLSSEAVSFLVPLFAHADITLAGDFRKDSTFVASLDPNERQLLKKLQALRNAHAAPSNALIYVSQWAPGSLWWNKLREHAPPDHAFRISRAMYEATRVPADWAPNMDRIDEFWVPFQEMKEILQTQHGVQPERVFVIEEGLDTRQTFNPSLFQRELARTRIFPDDVQDTFIFLSVFKWEERKAYKELIQAFSKAFPLGNESVSLFLRTSPSENFEGVVQRCAGREDARIRILPRQDDHRYQQMLYAADAFVLASHGEGWGRPIMEAMAMARPTVATNWSGPTQFMTERTGYLLPVTKMVKAEGLPGAASDAEWADIDVDALKHILVDIFENPRKASQRGRAARKHIAKYYDQDVVIQQVVARLHRACEMQARGMLPRFAKQQHTHANTSDHLLHHVPQTVKSSAPNSNWIWQWAHNH